MSKAKSKKMLEESTRFWVECGIDFKNRRVYLDEEVDEYSVGWINRALLKMAEDDPNEPITLYINCFGGSVYDGLGMYDVLTSLPMQINTVCVGSAMSMALILFLAGDNRMASKNSTFMAHNLAGGTYGKEAEIQVDAKEFTRLYLLLCDILGERTGKPAKWWQKKIKHEDFYFDIEKAKELGILKDLEE